MSRTLRLRADRPDEIVCAAEILRTGGLVAFPTETVYGLGANALLAAAVAGIFAAKQRPAWDPLIVHVAELAQIEELVTLRGEIAERTRILAEVFWPGPLTLLLPRRPAVPDEVTAGRAKVAVRLPAHPVAQMLLRAAGVPIAAPSANRFGHVSPTTAQHVLDDLDGRIDAVLDGGATAVGLESTVLDPTETPMVLYRAGAVTLEMLRNTEFPVQVYEQPERAQTEPRSLPSPGVGMRHYAPAAKLVLAAPNPASLGASVESALLREMGLVGVLLPGDWPAIQGGAVVEHWGRWSDSNTLAAELFAGLRALEDRGVSVIVCPLPEPGGLRDALRDRLLKAARSRD